MKKQLAAFLTAAMMLSAVTAAASGAKLTPSGASDGVSYSGAISLKADEYVKYSDVDFSGMKSIKITGEANWNSRWNGETFELRLDSETGKLLGYLSFDEDGKTESAINISADGVHDLYVCAMYGSAGASKISGVELFSESVAEKEKYVPVADEAMIDDYSDTWAATSGLGRHVADYSEVGGPKENKEVGLFYWNWNVDEADTLNVINNTTFQKEHPEAYGEDAYRNPAWPDGKTIYFLSEPLFGYYAGNDYWVYRRDAELLSDAGVDFLFLDYTNGKVIFRRNLEVMLKAFRDAKESGVDIPKIVFAGNMTAGVSDTKYMMKAMYLNYYKPGRYSDLWYYYEGKPLIMVHEENMDVGIDGSDDVDVALTDEILNYFTFRGIESDWMRDLTAKDNKWSIQDMYPQRTFGIDSEGNSETVIAAVASNRSIEDERLTPMSSDVARGKNYTETYGFDYRDGAYLYNYYFEEQIAGALETDTKILLISSWNEWTAVRNENYAGKFRNSFIDHFDEIGTRDLALSKDSNRDNGYLLLCDAIRKWKGVRPITVASEQKTIDTEDLSSWSDVGPTFYNTKGVYDRDCVGYLGVKYENTTARNNIVTSKAARDGEYLYFLANTEGALEGENTDNFMILYIDTDRNHATGWEGYDFKICKDKIMKYESGTWKDSGEKAQYKLLESSYVLKLAKSALSLVGDTTDIEFKWVDNSDDSDILNFYVYGLAAPNGRFNYVYTELEQKAVSEEDRALLKETTVVKAGSKKAVIRGGIMNVYEANTAYGVLDINGETYIPAACLSDALGYGTTRVIYEADREFLKIDTKEKMAYAVVGSLSTVSDGKDVYLSSPVISEGGVIYVPVSMMKEAFGLDVIKTENGAVAFGKNISAEAAQRAAELI